jgi:hypothetical protein
MNEQQKPYQRSTTVFRRFDADRGSTLLKNYSDGTLLAQKK